MNSLRERIVREVVARCASALAPIGVVRQPTTAIPREQTPVLVVIVESDAPMKRSNDRMERELIVRLVALARDMTDGHGIADDLICRAHVALFADPTLGGLALAITEQEADYQAEGADIDATAIPAIYRITYRTLISDITQGG